MTPRDPEPQGPADESAGRRAREAERRRRRARARVFGEVLPEGTRDDRADGWGERDQGSDEWLRGEVPPHHG